MLDRAGGIGVVLFNAQLGFVIQQAVENVGRVTHVGVDDLGIERRVLIGQMGVEQDAGLAAVLGVAVAGGFSVATRSKSLTVARRRGPRAPVRRKGQLVLGELAQTRARARLRHLLQPQIECVRQDGGQQQRPVHRGLGGFQVGEMSCEIGPPIHLE